MHGSPVHHNKVKKGAGRAAAGPRPHGKAGELLAVLDLGTNNCRLLIARPVAHDRFRAVDSFSRIVRLGEGVSASGFISDAAMERTIAALKICAQHIEKSGARHVRAIATQAARQAANAGILVARAKAEAGIDLAVISAEAEADLAALGCAPLIGQKYKGALIFDIGGGSTEIIHLRRGAKAGFDKIFAASLPCGVVSLSERFSAARGRAGFEEMRRDMHERFAPFAADGFNLKSEHLLGTSGTVTTLAALALGLPRYNRARVDGSWHDTRQVSRLVERLAGLDVPALARLGPIGPERADLMLAGCAIFSAICTLWPSPMLRVADRGLREGMLRQLRQELGQ